VFKSAEERAAARREREAAEAREQEELAEEARLEEEGASARSSWYSRPGPTGPGRAGE
jgi:hypothetical protein